MNAIECFPDAPIKDGKPVSDVFLERQVYRFRDACRDVHQIPYGYNQDRDDVMILFKENKGSCTSKHAVIAILAKELNLEIVKTIGIYAMTEAIVTGTDTLLDTFDLPYIPMIHCFFKNAQVFLIISDNYHRGIRPCYQSMF